MAIEETLIRIAAALEIIASAAKANGGAAASAPATSTEKAATTKPAAKPKAEPKVETKPASKNTREELAAAAAKLKEDKGAAVVKELIASVGKSPKLAEVADANVDALFDAIQAAIDEGNEPESGDEDI